MDMPEQARLGRDRVMLDCLQNEKVVDVSQRGTVVLVVEGDARSEALATPCPEGSSRDVNDESDVLEGLEMCSPM